MMDDEDGNEEGLFRRNRAAFSAGIAAIVVIGLGAWFLWPSGAAPAKKVPQVKLVTLQPQPPPPPPPPPPPSPPPKMVEQPQIKEPEIKQEKVENKPKDSPPAQLALDAKGDGPCSGALCLQGRPGGNPLLDGSGSGGSRWGWYASIVQTQIEQALRENQKTRNAKLRIEVRLWSDANGSIGRVQLMSSSGDPAIDEVIKNEVLTGLKLREPPPKDMPMPIIARLTERQTG